MRIVRFTCGNCNAEYRLTFPDRPEYAPILYRCSCGSFAKQSEIIDMTMTLTATVLRLPATEKACKRCGETKPMEDFYTAQKFTDGHRHICKECDKEESRIRHRASSGRKAERRRVLIF